MKALLIAGFAFTVALSSAAIAAGTGVQARAAFPPENTWVDLVGNYAELQQHQNKLDFLLAPIKSERDLDSYLTHTRSGDSPLDRLSAGAKERFLSSLIFNENGLVGYDYKDLETELSATEIHNVLSLFGAQRTTPLIRGARIENETDKLLISPPRMPIGDHEGYRCIGEHSCIKAMDMICMSGC